jgi:DNA polymerase-3 subunit alpha
MEQIASRTASEYTGPSEFVHLHLHTLYSSLDGVGSPTQYVDQCVKRGYRAIAATEHGHMGSVPDMYLECKKGKIKYISGCEIYFNDWEPVRQKLEKDGIKVRSQEWREANPELAGRITRNRHLTVLCKNETGFHNLVKLTTQAYQSGLFGLGKKQFNRIWFDKLCEHKEGLIILSGCLNGPVSHELRFKEITNREGVVVGERDLKTRINDAVQYIKKFKAVFGEDYYMELQMPGVEDDDVVFRTLIALADKFKIKLVLANDAHYLERKDFTLQKIMMAIAQGVTVDSPDLFHVNSDEQYFKTRGELWERFKNFTYCKGIDDGAFESACDNTLEIADKCEPFNIDPDVKIPIIDDGDTKLRMLVAKRLHEKGLDTDTRVFIIDGKKVTYVDQAKLEINRFIEKGFSGYFLITRDLITYGKNRGWPFSPRGSAGGSLVCYLLGITNIDPLLFGLSFDRFLSPARGGYMLDVKMPEPV